MKNENDLVEKYISYKQEDEEYKRLLQQISIFNRWIFLKNRGISLADYFIEREYRKIAVYGFGNIGCRFCEEMAGKGIEVVYGIDLNSKRIDFRNTVNIVGLEEEWDKNIDVVVVTVESQYELIKEMIEKKLGCKVVSIKEVVISV